MTDTKDRILDAAERLFALRGYASTSLRKIISEAGVNLAAVHYHFHSKEALLDAVILRRAGPVNRERLEMLGQFEREAGESPAAVERVLEAFLAPPFRLVCSSGPGGAFFARLMGRILAESDLLSKILRNHFGDVLARFKCALGRALPDVPEEELVLRMHFAVGAMAHTLRGIQEIEAEAPGFGSTLPPDAVLDRLVHFVSAGFRAPVGAAVSQET